MDRVDDLKINSQVRKVLVRHSIDLAKISLRTTRGVVHLSGELRRLPNAAGRLDAGLILIILAEIRRVQNVRRVTTDLKSLPA